jgi:regulator of sigma E protease
MLTTIIASFIVIGVIVFVHELGHFFAAKLSDVKVEVFSLGLGPRLWGFQYGETRYVVSAIPFGGYVKMEGESPVEEGEGVSEPGERSFLAKNKRTKAFIVVAGPAMNFLLAIVIFSALIYKDGVPIYTTRQVGVVEEGSPAWDAGLQSGDVITELAGEAAQNWNQIESTLEDRLGSRVGLVVEHDGASESLTLDLTAVRDYEDIGIGLYWPPVAAAVTEGSAAEKAGMQPGDRIVEIDGRAIRTWQDIALVVKPAAGRDLEISWVRGGTVMVSTARPDDIGGQGMLGLEAETQGLYELRPAGFFRSIDLGIRRTAWMAVQLLNLPRLILAGFPVRELLGGPVRIGQMAGETFRLGIGTFLAFIAVVSAQLSLVNLLPIPVLDGGHLLVLGVETVARRPVSQRQRIIAQQIGLALLIAFMVYVTMVDVSRLLDG